MADELAINVRNVRKDFHLPRHKSDSIKETIVQSFSKKDKGADTFHALRDVSFQVKKGEFFGILGRNGSGKSTLLKIISEIYQPSTGTVEHNGSLVSFIELGVGFKPQLSGRENVYLNGALLGFSKSEIDDLYNEIVAFAELEKFMDQKLKNYSSGMKVRLAFAVAIQAKSDILILDEVLAVGDAAFQRKCYDYFTTLKEDRRKTIVFVSHSMSAVRQYCDRAILIEGGKIIFEGDAKDAAQEYLRLFNPDQFEKERAAKEIARAKQHQDKSRWGSKAIEFESIEADVDDKELRITIDIVANKSVDNVAIGMDIYTAKNKLLTTGVGMDLMSDNLISLKKADKKRLQYVYDNNFGGGTYAITISLKSLNGSYVYDYWREAVSFTNTKQMDEYFPSRYPVRVIHNPDL